MIEIQEGNPPRPGTYIAYINGGDNCPTAQRIFLSWDGNRWGYPMSDQRYRGHIYGWIGPIPVMKLED